MSGQEDCNIHGETLLVVIPPSRMHFLISATDVLTIAQLLQVNNDSSLFSLRSFMSPNSRLAMIITSTCYLDIWLIPICFRAHRRNKRERLCTEKFVNNFSRKVGSRAKERAGE